MQARQISILSYNVWVDNDSYPQNQADIINYFIESSADVICLQEVTRQFFDLINANEKLSSNYSYQQPRIIDESPCGGLLMIKKNLNPTFYRQVPLYQSKSCRYLDYGSFSIEENLIAVGSVHLDSVFFNERATFRKTEQLKQACKKLSELKPDCMLVAGDMNFTSGSELVNENAAIDALELKDLWKETHITTEDENDEDYRNNDVTWDSANNSNVEYENEFHRPDRIFMRLFQPKVKVEVKEMERSVYTWSDHYPLKAVISFN